jgi:hypothetical protein
MHVAIVCECHASVLQAAVLRVVEIVKSSGPKFRPATVTEICVLGARLITPADDATGASKVKPMT